MHTTYNAFVRLQELHFSRKFDFTLGVQLREKQISSDTRCTCRLPVAGCNVCLSVGSGRYPLHHGINDWIPPSSSYGMPLNETTIADHFKTAGFKTHAIGKVRALSLHHRRIAVTACFNVGVSPLYHGFRPSPVARWVLHR